ncbi:DUF2306 domain-containing protein [Paenibacillus sp. EPM92]|uniref:DUF2306 domain-containing protein n=1 Tax=Paenibacillus sp. EPM92 TaxID=1561195 RepID=UPI00191538B0|nr:DUF2306 domain-containing protein [Paenibacillus sp. EPM92]
MELAFHFSRWLHIVAGFLALLLFWIPIVTKKGGKTHNRIGWIYVYAMTIVSISALYMGIFRIFLDPASDQDRISFSWFLIFISILSGASAWYGIRVLRFKRRQEKHRNVWDLMFPILLLLSGAGISIYGFTIAFPLLQYFPLLGVFLGVTHLLYWLKAPRLKMHWVMEHIAGMLTCCIATITAFTVFGAPKLLQIQSVSTILWFIPTIVIVPLLIGFSNYYKKKYNPPKNRATLER